VQTLNGQKLTCDIDPGQDCRSAQTPDDNVAESQAWASGSIPAASQTLPEIDKMLLLLSASGFYGSPSETLIRGQPKGMPGAKRSCSIPGKTQRLWSQ